MPFLLEQKYIFLHVLNMRLIGQNSCHGILVVIFVLVYLYAAIDYCFLFSLLPFRHPWVVLQTKTGGAVCTAVKGVMCPADFFPGVNNHPESTLLLSAAVVKKKTITHHNNNNNNNKIIT